MELYKYTRREHEQALMEHGRVRVGTLSDYRQAELHGNEVGDPSEGRVKLSGRFNNITSEQPLNHPALKGFIGGANIGSLVIENSTFQCSDLYVFSASAQFSEDALARWNEDPNTKYDTCYRIRFPYLFFRTISRALCDRAKFLGYTPVTYYDDSKPIDLASPLSYLHPARLKAGTNYMHQIEVRAFWQPLGPIEPLILDIPGLQKYVSHVFTLPG